MVGKAVSDLNSNITGCFKEILDEQSAAYEQRFKAVETEVSKLNATVSGHSQQLAAQGVQNSQFHQAIAALHA
eukprot:2532804-Karenia_brevis.AAC.1